eukprot:613047-Alexandrium_andersonii.AAC.1
MLGSAAPAAGAATGACQNDEPPAERLDGEGAEAPRSLRRSQSAHREKRPSWKDMEPVMMDWQGQRLLRINKSFHEADHPR